MTDRKSILATELQELAARTSKLADRMNQVQTALAALRGQFGQPPAKSATRSQKDIINESVIFNTVEAVVRAEGPMPQSVLLARLKQQLLSQGLSRVGVKPMMAKTLAHSRFKIDHGGMVSLA